VPIIPTPPPPTPAPTGPGVDLPTTTVSGTVGGVEVRVEVDDGGLVGVSAKLTDQSPVTLGDYTVPPNTFAAVRLYGDDLDVGTTNPIAVDGPLMFNGNVSFLRFNSAGDVIDSNINLNFMPGFLARYLLSTEVGNQGPAVQTAHKILMQGRK
jgi:hypothetical protein